MIAVACGSDPPSTSSSLDPPDGAACTPAWSPTWQQGSGANNWWVEYAIGGGTVQSAYLEVVGMGQVQLSNQWNKWVGVSSFSIPKGASVIVHARNTAGRDAQTNPFGYLVTTAPTTDPCAGSACVPNCTEKSCGDNGCGGSCGTCPSGQTCSSGACVTSGCVAAWNPTWRQGSGANTWWVEYEIGGSVRSAYVEVVGAGTVALSFQYDKWVGVSGAAIASGSQVIVHATSTSGQTAQTYSFRYLATLQPQTDPCAGSGAPPPPPNPCSLSAGMVSITMDDGYAPQYTLARQYLLARNMKATLYLVTLAVQQSWSGYLNLSQARALAADGNEIGSHSQTHPDLTQLSPAQIDAELLQSKQWIESNLGVSATSFATPYGADDATVISIAKTRYQSLRTVRNGLNFAGDDPYQLKGDEVFSTTTPAAVQSLVQQAQTAKGWRILVFHNFTSGTPPDAYSYRISDFSTALGLIASTGVPVVTVAQGVARIRCP